MCFPAVNILDPSFSFIYSLSFIIPTLEYVFIVKPASEVKQFLLSGSGLMSEKCVREKQRS